MKKIIKFIPLVLIIMFLGLYYSYQNGYYEKYMNEKIRLTNYSIEEFEQDIKDLKDVSLKDYIKEEKSYSTKVSNLSLKVSSNIENVINKCIKIIFKKLANYME